MQASKPRGYDGLALHDQSGDDYLSPKQRQTIHIPPFRFSTAIAGYNRGGQMRTTQASHDRRQPPRKGVVCTSSQMFLLMSLTLITTIWLQVSLSKEMVVDFTGHVERSLALSIRLPPRPFVAWDEFFKKSPTNDVVRKFFDFQEPTADDIPTIESFWKCEDQERRGKLVYLHLYRTAGFTIRALLRAYANFCGAGIAFVSSCLDVSHASMQGNEFWMNEGLSSPRRGRECWLSLLENRTGQEYALNAANAVTTSLLMENQVDILGDHIPVGAIQNWKDADGNYTEARYVTFFRDPVETFVSNNVVAQHGGNRSVQDMANDVYMHAAAKLKDGKYLDKTSNHFMSPDQKWWIDDERIEWTHERRVNLTMKNIVDYKVTIGVVERFPQSLDLLQHVMDRQGSLTEMFRFFASPEKIDKVNSGSISKSRQYTASIVAAIRANETQRLTIDEYLKYEQQIYDFAVKVHNIQWAKLPQKTILASDKRGLHI